MMMVQVRVSFLELVLRSSGVSRCSVCTHAMCGMQSEGCNIVQMKRKIPWQRTTRRRGVRRIARRTGEVKSTSCRSVAADWTRVGSCVCLRTCGVEAMEELVVPLHLEQCELEVAGERWGRNRGFQTSCRPLKREKPWKLRGSMMMVQVRVSFLELVLRSSGVSRCSVCTHAMCGMQSEGCNIVQMKLTIPWQRRTRRRGVRRIARRTGEVKSTSCRSVAADWTRVGSCACLRTCGVWQVPLCISACVSRNRKGSAA
eukprot:jgi/Botrbrau1/10136/Bobra.0191s0008.1